MTSTNTRSVVSADGTRIGYQAYGSGPGVVLVQGAMATAYQYRELAEALASSFTVYVPDRRGRGLSPHPYHDDHTVQTDVDDLAAMLGQTGARFVYGLSSGADIVLEAALRLPEIRKVAVYEPAIFPNGLSTTARRALVRFDRKIAAGRLPGAMVAAMKAAGFAPALLNYLPDWLLALPVRLLMNREAKNGSGDEPTMAELAFALPYDFTIVGSMEHRIPAFRDIRVPVLLLGGSRSAAFLKPALNELESVIPGAKRVEFAGLDHAGSWNRDSKRNPHGDAALVADALREFFA